MPKPARVPVFSRRIGLVFVCLALAACGSAAPDEVLDSYLDAFARADLDAMLAVFTPFTVVTGHPLDSADISGLDAIRSLEQRALAWARSDTPMRVVEIRVSGDTATFDQIIYGQDGSCISSVGSRIVVDTGKIMRWDWGTNSIACD